LNLSVRAGQRIVLTGPNGSGKTTLLRTVAGRISALGGEIRLGSSVRLGYLTQDQSGIDPQKTVLETALPYFRNQTEARKFLAAFLFSGDEPMKSNSLLSYGQRARLMLGLLIADQCNCLLLDEPINHLDIPSRTQFEQALNQFDGAVLAVVHDRYFIERFADEIWWVENNTVRREVIR
jgi:ATP-binding cassette, subfamily F, member 3